MKFIKLLSALLLFVILFSACASRLPYYQKGDGMDQTFDENQIDYELFLVGDIGLESNGIGPDALVSLIKKQLKSDASKQSVVFLGNSVLSAGLPESVTAEYQMLKGNLQQCIDQLVDNTENVFFIPGNHEWTDGQNYTINALQNSEDFIEELAHGKDVFQPSGGCGEPSIIQLTNDLILVLVDSQWLVQSDDSNERKKSGCEIDNNFAYINYMREIVARNKKKNIIIAAHHPVFSNGTVGGNYPLKNHLLPLPVLGSLMTGVRKIMGGPQQFSHPDYEAFRSAYLSGIQNCEGCINVSGHDNNLQYFFNGGNHFAVAGSGSKVSYVRKADGAVFSSMSQGFVKIIHTKDLELWLEIYGIDSKTQQLKRLYRQFLYKKEVIDFEDKTIFKTKDERPSSIRTAASEHYGKRKFLRGNFYRKTWKQEIEIPLLWLDEAHGGLTPIQQGGGFQTNSLRLENPEGEQYVLRSINKEVEKVVPPALRHTFAQNLVQDGIAASHPYGAFVIPRLADAAGIYHANPKIVYLPAQENLGDYNPDFAEAVYLFEERPGGNTSRHEDFGKPAKTVNTLKLLDLLNKNQKHQVDQQFVLRSRLFDIWIGDWDRHDDQWRWAAFKQDDFTLYRPIPRDRDQVFFKNDGFLDFIASRPYFNPGLRKFQSDIDYLPGLIFNARYFDRSFLHALQRSDFIAMAKKLQEQLTDQIIDETFKAWPIEVRALDEAEIKEKLKARRNKLVEYATAFYDHLYKEVTIVGTKSADIFVVESQANENLVVKVFHKNEQEDHLIYHNTISGKITRELRLYGLKKGDQFLLKGDFPSSIKIRIIGGGGEDLVTNQSQQLRPLIYDYPKDVEVLGEYQSKIKEEKGINRYNRKDWQQNRFIHFPIFSFYTDEGIGLTYNFWWKKFGFRSDPYQSDHRLSFSYFPTRTAFIAKYIGHFPKAIGQWDFELDLLGMGPVFTQFYYGKGNRYVNFETTFPDTENANSQNFHIVKGTRLDINPSLVRTIGKSSTLRINPSFEFFNFQDMDEASRFYLLPEADLSAAEIESKYYGGLQLIWETQRIDKPAVPHRGFNYRLFADYRQNLEDTEHASLTIGTELQTYIPFNQSNTLVLAMNIGGAYTVGDPEFFHLNYLSNASRLRGFRNNRFAGEGIAYHATDLRLQLFRSKGALPLSFGIFAAFDYGRAWYNDLENDDNSWHTSYGGGVFLTPLDLLGFKIGYFVGDEDTTISIGGALAF